MRIAIYNPATMAFNVATPEEQPLGGMASCMCYLARALAGRGHQVTLISVLPPDTPQMLMGVEHLSTSLVLPDAINFFRAKDYDAVIAVNYPNIASYVAMGSPNGASRSSRVGPTAFALGYDPTPLRGEDEHTTSNANPTPIMATISQCGSRMTTKEMSPAAPSHKLIRWLVRRPKRRTSSGMTIAAMAAKPL